jgi:NADPH2:quinone reductase
MTTKTVPQARAAIPATMRAAAIDRAGGPEVLSIHSLPVPVPDAHEILIAVDTAGVAKWDADIRGGWSPTKEPLRYPLVLGTDGSGTVAALGSRVRRFELGERVYGFVWDTTKGGFYAEYVAVAADNASAVPKPLDMVQAGAAPASGLTALEGIDDALHVQHDEALIIYGASGGLGTLAVQFAKLRRARVLAIGSGQDGVALVKSLGADGAIDGHSGDVAGAIHRFAPEGVDAVLGLAGGEVLELCIKSLRDGGRLAYPNGIDPAPKKRRGIETTPYDGVPGVKQFEHLSRAIEEARVRVPIAAEYALADAAKAHERLAQGHIVGKVVLRAQR